MKRIQNLLLAILMLVAAPAFLISCQEDAPEINYTMNVTVNNDFSKIVEAINNGTLKNEEAIRKLTEAIDKMNTDQAAKLQAIIDVLNSVNTTLDTKLVAIEAAMKAQTLSLEGKLNLLETAIKGLPDYSDKFDAVITGLNAMKTQIESLSNGQEAIADAIATVQQEIANLIAEVKNGNTTAAAALVQIIAKLDELKAAISSGSGGGTTPQYSYMTLTTTTPIGQNITLFFDPDDVPVVEGASEVSSSSFSGLIKKGYVIDQGTITVKGKVSRFWCQETNLTALDVSHNPDLTYLSCVENKLTALDLSKNSKLREVGCNRNNLSYATLKLPKVTSGVIRYKAPLSDGETQTLTPNEVKLIKLLGWQVQHSVNGNWVDYPGE